jgi:hypothetical protein
VTALPKTPQILSSGAKKDLLVLFFVKAIFQVALESETIGSIPRERDNKLHDINKRIDRRVRALMTRMSNTIDKVINHELAEWLHSKTKGKVFSILTRMAHKDVQLETLGLYMLFVNFCERDKKLDAIFESYVNADLYFDNVDLLKEANVSEDIEAGAMRMAYDVIAEIKG